MKKVSVGDFKARFSAILDEVLGGQKVATANLSAKGEAIISDRSRDVQVGVVSFWEINSP